MTEMTSAIDATFPVTGSAVSKALERANWGAAKGEIERLQTTVNVRDYGTVGNGSTDDTAAINAAIAAANATSDYATLLFPRSQGYRVYGSTPLTALINDVSVIMQAPIIYNVGGTPLITDFLWTIGRTSAQYPGGASGSGVQLELWFETIGTNSYAANPNMGGVRLYNLRNSTVVCRHMGGFTRGIQLNASAGRYCSGNDFHMKYFSNQIGLELLADGASAWIIHNTFYGGNFGHDAPNTVDKVGVRARTINGGLGMHSLKFHNTDFELGTDGSHRGSAFETEGYVVIFAYGLYLESNSHLLYNTDGLGYVGARYVRATAAELVVSEGGGFSGSYGISPEQADGGWSEVAGTGNRTLGQSDVGSIQRLTSGTATWTVNKFMGKITVDNIDGGTLTLAAGSGVTLSAASIAAGKVATLLGRVAGTKVQVLLDN